MSFTETLREWQNFYFMIGGAATGLIGLMFVAISLGMHLVSDENKESIKIFVTPSIFYFGTILIIACIMLAPNFEPPFLATLLLIVGIVGLVNTVPVARKLMAVARKHQDFDLLEYLGQIILPVANYVLLTACAVGFAATHWTLSLVGLWLANILLLLAAISNTWSMVIWIVEQRE